MGDGNEVAVSTLVPSPLRGEVRRAEVSRLHTYTHMHVQTDNRGTSDEDSLFSLDWVETDRWFYYRLGRSGYLYLWRRCFDTAIVLLLKRI